MTSQVEETTVEDDDVDEVVDDVPEPVYVFWPGGVQVQVR